LKPGVEDENTQILNAILEAEEKEYKPPVDLVIEAPQATKAGGDQSPKYQYPLMNFLKNKRVGDISPAPRMAEQSQLEGNQSSRLPEDLVQKLKSTKDELHEVLSEIDKSPIRRRDMSGSPDDNMDDLSPET